MKEVTIDFSSILAPEVSSTDGKVNLVGRGMGRRVREILADVLARDGREVVFRLDFSTVGIVDFSSADEVLGKLLPRVLADEFGAAYLCLINVSAHQMENVAAALEKKGFAVAARTRRGNWTFLGKLNPYLQETFNLVYDHRSINARELSSLLSLTLNSGSTRLLNLYKQRLVGRHGNRSPQGAREYIYVGFNGGFSFA